MGDQVDVQRRRKSSGPQGRAEQPIRRDSGGSQGGGFPSSGGFRPSGGRFSGGRLGGCGTILLIILFLGYYLLSGQLSGSDGTDQSNFPQEPIDQSVPQQNDQPLPPSNFTPPVPASGNGQNWLVMLYQDADDQILEKDIYIDLNEAERVGSSDRVKIVTQIDRFRGAYSGDGNWTGTRRYFVTQDNNLDVVNSQLVQDLGEVDMSSGNSLVDFVAWAMKTYPADHYALILSDHGMGWPGGWTDPDPGGGNDHPAPLASRLGSALYLNVLDQALGQIQNETGAQKLDLIGMDACLMSQLEVLGALQPYGRYAVLSEETEPSLGWAYASFLGALTTNPDMRAQDLSRLIVQGYVEDDQRILDPQARADFLRGGSPLGGLYGFNAVSAEEVARQLEKNITLSAIDLEALPGLMKSVNDFSYALQDEDQSLVAGARGYAASYTSIFGEQVGPSYIDLGNFVQIVGQETANSKVKQAAGSVIASLKQAVIAEKHGPAKRGSTGIAIYFPNSTLYRSPLAGPQSYTAIASRFAAESLWDDFLAYHYIDRNFESTATTPYVPPSGFKVRAPGQGTISLSEITASSRDAAPNQPVRLSVDITGDNIGYVYLFVGYYDQRSNSIFVADTDYLESPDTRQVDDAFYPKWPSGDTFTMNFNWEPTVFALSDGNVSTTALFTPVSYGASAEDAEYAVDGMYRFADGSEPRFARILLRDGKMRQVFGFTSTDGSGAPREITPQTGDTFTILEKWLDLDSNGNVTGTTRQEGKTLTFGSNMFEWQELFAAAGDYVVGFIVEDLDGNQYPVYTQIAVR